MTAPVGAVNVTYKFVADGAGPNFEVKLAVDNGSVLHANSGVVDAALEAGANAIASHLASTNWSTDGPAVLSREYDCVIEGSPWP